MIAHELIHYNYIGEVAGLVLSCLLLLIMLYTHPKKSYVFQFLYWGNVLSIISIIINIVIIITANNPDEFYSRNLFVVLQLFFLLVYLGIMYCIFSYVNMMSIVRRKQRKEFHFLFGFMSLIYILAMAVQIASKGMYIFEIDMIDICSFTKFYSIAGIVCALQCLNATVSNRRNVSRVIIRAVFLIAPIDLMILLSQVLSVEKFHTVYASITYVPVFILGYVLFHAVPYDEISGCQGTDALIQHINKINGKKDFHISYIIFSLPGIENLGDDSVDLMLKGVEACRKVEAIGANVKLYRVAEDKFVTLIEGADENTFVKDVDQIRGIMDNLKSTLPVPFNYIMISGGVTEELDTAMKIRQFYQFVSRKLQDQNNSVFYMVKTQDYDDFDENYAITIALKDIRNRMDFDDERVIVYAQPIYSVESGSFRAAEALTRLKLGDRIISPDKFIPIAEASGTIHAITCIVLDRICRTIQSLDEYYDFDAISINCSSKELSHEDMHHDLMDVIEKYDIDITKIRVEVTESAMFENYEVANENMNALTRAGIHLYLDDFGTGYSSLERVMNCPFKTIKFDKTLLYKSLDDNRMDDIVTYMIEVFKKNGFVTLVEGVEDENQSQYSVEHGFDYIQGYHYAKPEPLEEVKKYFSRKKRF